MRKRLYALNLVLLALVAALAWRVQTGWTAARDRHQALRQIGAKSPALRQDLPLTPVPPVTPASYLEIAAKMLFARDRNPTVVVDVAPPKPMPPLPVAQGIVNLGAAPMALLSEKAGATYRGYRAGESVGDFKVLEIRTDELVFEWDGKRIEKKLEELMEAGARFVPPPAPSDSAPAATSNTIATGGKTGPGAPTGPTTRACQPGDPSPAGTIVDGMKKLTTRTPFGNSCVWQAVQ